VAKTFPPGFTWKWTKWHQVKLEHRVDFRDAVRIFDGDFTEDLEIRPNPASGEPEERRRAVGFVGEQIYRVVYKLEGNRRHIITAFKAGQREANEYLHASFGEPEIDPGLPWQILRRRLSGKRTPKRVKRRGSARRSSDPTNESDP
jgi:uncharacterized DUF497 family protein